MREELVHQRHVSGQGSEELPPVPLGGRARVQRAGWAC